MNTIDNEIKKYLSEEELLCQLAEECNELGKAALKLRRVLDGTNPTPKTEEEARDDLIEEAADVYNVLGLLLDAGNHAEIYDIIRKKKTRWIGRLEENQKKIVAAVTVETKQIFGRCDEDWSEG